MPRLLRTLRYAMLGAACAVLLGKLLQLATGLPCSCFLGNAVVAVPYGALGGAFFALIYDPRAFAQSDTPTTRGT